MKNVSDSIAISFNMVKAFGLTEAYILTFLLSKQQDELEKATLSADGYFCATAADIENAIGLSGRTQRTALENLSEAGLLNTRIKSVNNVPKRFIQMTAQANHIANKAIVYGKSGGTLEVQKIEAMEDLQRFDGYSFDDLKNKSTSAKELHAYFKSNKKGGGVYILFDAEKNIIYIGKSKRFADRLKQHIREHNQELQYVTLFYTTTAAADIIEPMLIKKFNPKYNKAHNG